MYMNTCPCFLDQKTKITTCMTNEEKKNPVRYMVYLLKTVGHCPDTKFSRAPLLFEAP